MPGGNSFDHELEWNASKGGFIASGPHDWKSCDWIRVVVFQDERVMATAEGKPTDSSYNWGDKRWILEVPLGEIDPKKTLANGAVSAAAIAVMTTADGSGKRLTAWRRPEGVSLVGRP